jgi:hypothetical protein
MRHLTCVAQASFEMQKGRLVLLKATNVVDVLIFQTSEVVKGARIVQVGQQRDAKSPQS